MIRQTLSNRRIPIYLILLLATFLRFYQIGEESFWIDEFNSLRSVDNLSFSFRVLYFALLKIWMFFGTTDAWLRSLAAIFGIGCVALSYKLGCLLVDRSVGLIAATMIGVSPFFIYSSQEVRMYSLSVFLSLASTLALVLAINNLHKRGMTAFAFWVALRILAIFTVPLNGLLLIPDTIVILSRFHRERRILIMAACSLITVGIIMIPVIPQFIAATLRFASLPRSPVTAPQVLRLLQVSTTYWPGLEVLEYKWFYYIIYGSALGFLIVSILFDEKHSLRLNWLIAWGFIPALILFLISISILNLWVPRYLLVSTPYLIILLAASFVRVWFRKRSVAILVALIYLTSLSGGLFSYYGKLNKTDWRAAVQIIDNFEKPGDIVLTTESVVCNYVFNHYGSVKSPIYLLLENDTFAPDGYDSKIIKEKVKRLPNTRIWLFSRGLRDIEDVFINELLLDTMEKRFKVLKHRVFEGHVSTIDVFLLAPRNAKESA
jgi:mannosyltransferase